MSNNEEGFTLLELVAAVAVAGIIAAVALPTFNNLRDDAVNKSAAASSSFSSNAATAENILDNLGVVTGGGGVAESSASSTN